MLVVGMLEPRSIDNLIVRSYSGKQDGNYDDENDRGNQSRYEGALLKLAVENSSWIRYVFAEESREKGGGVRVGCGTCWTYSAKWTG